MKFVVANFKSYQTSVETKEWIRVFKNGYLPKEGIEVVLAPGFTNIQMFVRELGDVGGVAIGSQDASPFPQGAYTGAVNARQLADLRVRYAIVGHAERRKWFHETHPEVANKCRELLEQKITPILCVDEDYLNAQIAVLENTWIGRLIVAYEPVAAIGSGQAEYPKEAGRIAKAVRAKMPEAKAIIYGGSVNAENAGSYLSNGFDGLLVGEKVLRIDEFMAIIESIKGLQD